VTTDHTFSRRDFLKLAAAGLGVVALRPARRVFALPEYPQSETGILGRVLNKLDIHSKPDVSSPVVKTLYEDALLPWLREVNALNVDLNVRNQRWVETPDGYIWSSILQPVRNIPNQPVNGLPANSPNGFWGEVTVPYVDLVLENPPARGPAVRWLAENNVPNRLYYSQTMWVDQVKQGSDGRILYRVNERYGSFGDVFWADGAAFRILTDEDIAPINPEVDPNEKTVKVNLTYQTLSCFEGQKEVYFCRVSTGILEHSTPLGEHTTWRKLISVHMAGGTVAAGFDTAGISWTNLFAGTGVAIHSTFWHNDFGQQRSHGCVNCAPEDARWIWRWTTPEVPLEPGDVTVQMPGGSHVIVEERLV
jgi:lipoprotein-anchoring transpeptidase ErfK/SrfK